MTSGNRLGGRLIQGDGVRHCVIASIVCSPSTKRQFAHLAGPCVLHLPFGIAPSRHDGQKHCTAGSSASAIGFWVACVCAAKATSLWVFLIASTKCFPSNFNRRPALHGLLRTLLRPSNGIETETGPTTPGGVMPPIGWEPLPSAWREHPFAAVPRAILSSRRRRDT
jgi:hypothetical protein